MPLKFNRSSGCAVDEGRRVHFRFPLEAMDTTLAPPGLETGDHATAPDPDDDAQAGSSPVVAAEELLVMTEG